MSPRFITHGVIAYADASAPGSDRERLGAKLVRLLNLHARYRASAVMASRLPGVGLAIDAVQHRLSEISEQRMAA